MIFPENLLRGTYDDLSNETYSVTLGSHCAKRIVSYFAALGPHDA